MYQRSPSSISFGMGGGAPVPRDIWFLLGIVFATFSLQFFPVAPLIEALRLTPGVYGGALWQLATYPFIGTGSPGLWFLLSLLILFWFGRDVYHRLGRRGFWTLLAWGGGTAAVVAVAVDLLTRLLGLQSPYAFGLMQGQHMLITILIAAFATLFGQATILLFFIIPVQAKWFLGLEILFAFMGYLSTKDLPGFLGICAAVGITYSILTGRRPGRLLREWRLRLEAAFLKARMRGRRRRSGIRVIDGEGRGNGRGNGRGGGWVH